MNAHARPVPEESARFISLLHVAPQKHTNLAAASDALTVYALSAALLAKSLAARGHDYALVTNHPELIVPVFARHGMAGCRLIAHDFTRDVPAGVPFYSAHFKLDLFAAIAAGAFGETVGILDVDGVLLRPLRLRDGLGALSVYDISTQEFPAYQQDRVEADLASVAGVAQFDDARWYGGEYVLGTRDQFAALSHYVEHCWQRYRVSIGTTRHVGDEMVTSAALNLMRRDGIAIADAGASGEVARWWSARTLLPQVPFSAAARAAFLHLPADKEFLARQAASDFAPAAFLGAYRRHAGMRIAMRTAWNWLDRVRGTPVKYVPSL